MHSQEWGFQAGAQPGVKFNYKAGRWKRKSLQESRKWGRRSRACNELKLGVETASLFPLKKGAGERGRAGLAPE